MGVAVVALRFTAVAFGLAGAACGNKPDAQPPPSPQPVTIATPAQPLVPSPVDASAPRARVWLPSGDYTVATEVVRDTCSGGDAGAVAPITATLFVQMKVWKDALTGSFPLPVPRRKGYSTVRSDIALDPPAPPTPFTLHGVGAKCPAYETKTLYRIISMTDTKVQIEYTRDFGDAATCPPRQMPPSNCALDYVYTFTLAKKLCDAECAISFTKEGDAGAVAKCDCGDRSAPDARPDPTPRPDIRPRP